MNKNKLTRHKKFANILLEEMLKDPKKSKLLFAHTKRITDDALNNLQITYDKMIETKKIKAHRVKELLYFSTLSNQLRRQIIQEALNHDDVWFQLNCISAISIQDGLFKEKEKEALKISKIINKHLERRI